MERILANMTRVYRDELLYMKQEYDEKLKYETIERQAKEIVRQVKGAALQGKTSYIVDDRFCQQMKFMEETISVLREIFQDCEIKYEKGEKQIPAVGRPLIQMTEQITIDWSA